MPETKDGNSTKRYGNPPVKETVPTEPSTQEDDVAPSAQAEVVQEPVAEPPTKVKVKYIGGQGIELAYPLSNGQRSFVGGKVYELSNYGDFCRLTEASPNFVEVKDEPAR